MIEPRSPLGLTLSQCVELAFILEATAPKPGNVHRGADFDDLGYLDFLASAVVASPELAKAAIVGVGPAIHAAIRATRSVVATNTNLGMALLLGPLCAAVGKTLSPTASNAGLRDGLKSTLAALDSDDAREVYAAITAANPGGLGHVDEMDVREAPPPDLLTAMRAAADRDWVARQWATDFQDLFDHVAPWIASGRSQGWSLTDAIVHAHIRALAIWGDSLIARKSGGEASTTAQTLAARTLETGAPGDSDYLTALEDFDFWLRADGRKRNPGTTADLIAAGLFICLWEGTIGPPFA